MAKFGRPRWAKIGFLGFAGSGKTWTGIDVALWLHKRIKSDRPLRVFDTEGGFDYQIPRIVKATGLEPDGEQAQSFDSLRQFTRGCMAGDICIIDSITHPWRELFAAAEKAKGKGLPAIMHAKELWLDGFTKWFLTSPCHVIICGRAGYEFDYEEIDGKKQLVKTNTKMKTESELGFEPSLLVEMERRDREDGTVGRIAIIKKDRFGLIDGKIITNPSAESFAPHLEALDLGNPAPPTMDTEDKTADTLDRNGDAEFQRKRTERTVLLEEIQDELVRAFPSTSGKDRTAKIDLLKSVFGTSAWTALEKQYSEYPNGRLRDGLNQIRERTAAAASGNEVAA